MAGLVIIGGSYAGLNIAISARQHGYAEPIRMLANEPMLPYHRPPLSKGYLLGATAPDTLPLRGAAFYAEQGIEVLLDTEALAIDSARRLQTTRGAIDFDVLAITTGARARSINLPGSDLDGVVTLRSLADAEAIRQRLASIESVVIIGAGFIGLELAASLRKLGKAVTVLEGQPRVLARAIPPRLSAFIEAEHRKHGIDLRCNAGVAAIEGVGGKVSSVLTTDGARCPADLVVLAVGATPNIELGAPLGLVADGAIKVDSVGRTAAENIYAAGDCTVHPNAFSGTLLRLESVQSATDQAKAAGAAIAGVRKPNESVPWFWSDQYDLKLQMVGLSQGADREIVRGSVEDKKFSIFYLKGKRIVGIDSVNAVADHVLGRRLLSQRIEVQPEVIGDPKFDLKSLERAA
jgi:3-phenylpropionate/trans-cinnamate dioxygenase ferredoxin reductase subunit